MTRAAASILLTLAFIACSSPLLAEPNVPAQAFASDMGRTQQEYGSRNSEDMADRWFLSAAKEAFTLRQLMPYFPGETVAKIERILDAAPALEKATPDAPAFEWLNAVEVSAARNGFLKERLEEATVGELVPFLPPSLRTKAEALNPKALMGRPEQTDFPLPAYVLEYARLKAYQQRGVYVAEAAPYLTRALRRQNEKPLPVYLPPTIIPGFEAGENWRPAPVADATNGHHRIKALIFCIDHLGVKEADVPFSLKIEKDFRDKTWTEYVAALEAEQKGLFRSEVLLAREEALKAGSADHPDAAEYRLWLEARDHARLLHRSFRDEDFGDNPLRSALGNLFFKYGIDSDLLKDYIEFYVGDMLRAQGIVVAPGSEMDPQVQQLIAKALFESDPLEHAQSLENAFHRLMHDIRPISRALPAEERAKATHERRIKVQAMLENAVVTHIQSVLGGFGVKAPVEEFLNSPTAFIENVAKTLPEGKKEVFYERSKSLIHAADQWTTLKIVAFVDFCAERGLNQAPPAPAAAAAAN